MLRTRVITALVLVALFLVALVSPMPEVFFGFCGIALVIAAWEWSGLMALSGWRSKSVFPLIIFLLLLGLYSSSALARSSQLDWVSLSLYLVLILWPLFLVLVVIYPRLASVWNNTLFKALVGLAIFIQAWASVVWIRQQEFYLYLMIYSIALVALSDIGAYFAGKRFGRVKLAVNVSPGKSWEGVIGGMTAALSLSVVALVLFGESVFAGVSLPQMLLIAISVSLVSVLGDLSISMLKRAAGVKDSGNILPGHGGVLDRIDGMLAALPVFAFLMHVVVA